MSFLKKMFGSHDAPSEETKQLEQHELTENENTSIEELFSIAFKQNGGKFLYCENIEEIKNNLEDILQENDWFESEAICNEPHLFGMLDENNLNYKETLAPKFLFSTCESLIAEDGSVLFCSDQIKQSKPNQLPINLIVFSTTSRIVATKTDALTAFQKRHKNGYPSNMTAIKYFEESQEEDFLHYGSIAKNIYLLLLEDQ